MVKKSGPTGLPRGWAGLERMIENEKREREPSLIPGDGDGPRQRGVGKVVI